MKEQININLGTNLDNKKIELTLKGANSLKKRLNILIKIERPGYLRDLKEAREQGDLSENADYDAAKNKQAEVETEIQRIENILARSIIASDSENRKHKKIEMGALVTYLNLSNKKEKTIKIVGNVESNTRAKVALISQNAPLTQAIWGLKTGDKATIKVKNPYTVLIKKIS